MSEPAQPVGAAIALGSNLGDREAALENALRRLRATPGLAVERVSAFIQTPALTLPGSDAQPDYLNAAAVLETTLPPRKLLEVLLEIERHVGRDRASEPRWGARVLDLDLLLYGDRVIDEPGLIVPHPRLHERDFVLEPLAEIWPDALHPTLNSTVRHLASALQSRTSG